MIEQMFDMIEQLVLILIKSENGFLLNRKKYGTERSDLDFYGKEGKYLRWLRVIEDNINMHM